ncbi:hypothetical protein HII36_49255, partial [Nonomuraea sp. NN258]|uniref:hypothetical protein n=1 Tax=Nonomuraea antri TaxID=2730852 RepID=UPI001568EEA9
MMVSPPRVWRLERNDRRLLFAAGGDGSSCSVVAFGETDGAAVGPHRHPAWKIVLPLGGEYAEVRLVGGHRPAHVAAPALVVPPQLPHTSAVTGGYVALFIDPWALPAHPGPLPLDLSGRPVPPGLLPLGRAAKRRLLDALGLTSDLDAAPGVGDVPDLNAALRELHALVGHGRRLDPRLAHALHLLDA